MDVDEPWQHRFSRGFDDVRFECLRIRRVAFVNLSDLSAFNEDRRGLDDFAIADKQPRVLNQQRFSALDVAREDFRFREILPAPRLVDAENKKRRQRREHPKLCRIAQLFFFLPAEKFRRDEQTDQRRDDQRDD